MQTNKNAAILFEPDGYVLSGDRIMGRQAAGNSVLRSAIAHAKGEPLWCYTPFQQSAGAFREIVASVDPQVKTEWCPANAIEKLRQVGTLYLPGPNLDTYANQRLRVGPSAYSLCGVTHTTASHSAMLAIASLLTAPVMPWDALICTSNAVRSTVNAVLEEQTKYLSWRFGSSPNVALPQLPIIPLGIQCDDFDFDREDKKSARKALNLQEDEIVFLFVGRLSYHAKAHPHAMMLALEDVARSSGKSVTLIQCGWFANPGIEKAFKEATQKVCPSVKCLFVDGKNPNLRNNCWAGSDIFISLVDNYQETFGITPIEAMAAGLPVIVSDWDGYKDTVPDGQVGFRIPTWSLAEDNVHGLAHRHEAGIDTYDRYCGYTCQTVAINQTELRKRIHELIGDADLRARLGEAGRNHAKNSYEWNVVYKQYLALWEELSQIRRQQSANQDLAAAPHAAACRMDPYKAFVSYPTQTVTASTRVTLLVENPLEQYIEAVKLGLFDYASSLFPPSNAANRMFSVIKKQRTITVAALSKALGARIGPIQFAVTLFAKMGLVTLSEK